MNTSTNTWFEVWYDEGSELLPAYLLIVVPDLDNPGQVKVYDPLEQRIIHNGQNYEETRLWLTEDEYRLVEGRMFADEIFPLRTSTLKP